MSTHSLIGLETPNGQVNYIYCQSGGHPIDNGFILLKHFKSRKKVEGLLKRGYMSQLNKFLGKKHDFHDYKLSERNQWCVFYHRDRNESWENVKDHTRDLSEVLDDLCNRAEYLYVYDLEGNWRARSSKDTCWNNDVGVEKVAHMPLLNYDYCVESLNDFILECRPGYLKQVKEFFGIKDENHENETKENRQTVSS